MSPPPDGDATGGAPVAPLARVQEASLALDGGPVRVTVSRLAALDDVADALASAGARPEVEHGRLTAVTTPSRLVDAVGRTLGREPAETLEAMIDRAVAGWIGPAPDVVAPTATLSCSRRALVMGVVNVTPDSFSDGGEFWDPDRHPEPAITHGQRLAEAGADIVDVGGESTRPGAEPVAEEDELRRVVPVVEALAADGHTVSVDTTKSEVARAAVAAGAGIVNDVSAGVLDERMLATVAELGVPYVLMHMRGTPRTMQRDPTYDDVVADVYDFLAEGLDRCETAGIDRDAVLIDPGIGFGKTVEHNLLLLRRLRDFTSLARPVLVGTSRKSFLGRISGGRAEDDRFEESIVSAALAVANGASVVRVHDVAATVRAVRVARAVAEVDTPQAVESAPSR